MIARLGSTRVLARRTALGTLAASVAVVGLPAFAQAAPPTAPFISEIHYDDAGADVDEFVEVQLPVGTTSSDWSIVFYNGNGGASYASVPLPPTTASAGAPAVVVIAGPSAGIQNGDPDGLALVGPAGLREFLSYGGTFTAVGGPAAGVVSTDIGVKESAVPEG